MVTLVWGLGELEREMVAVDVVPREGDLIEIEIHNTASDPGRWQVAPRRILGKVTALKHEIHIEYGNDVGPRSFQSVTVEIEPR